MPIFRKKQENKPVEKKTALEEFLNEDKETYEALFPVLLLDPRKIDASMKQAVENARKSEKDRDVPKAKMWYELAGGLAIYEGNVKKVIECFGEAERLTGQSYLILKNPEKVVAKAQEYYKKYLI